jgi:hypothetical protein
MFWEWLIAMFNKTPSLHYHELFQLQQQVMKSVKTLSVPTNNLDALTNTIGDSGEEELPKRCGKHRRRRKKSGKDGSREPEKEFRGFAEPGETQVRI